MNNFKAKIIVLFIVLITIPVILSGCALFKMLGLTGTTQLDAPTNVVLSEDSSYISWTATPFATKYEIYIDGTKIAESNINKYYFEDTHGSVVVQIRAISASNKYTESELTASQSFNIKSRLVIQNLSHVITASEFIVYWDDVDYKLKYAVKLYEDDVLVDEGDVYTASITLSHYDSNKDYKFEIKAYADSSDRRIDSDTNTYIVQKGAAASIALSADYDKKEGVAAQFDNTNPSAIKIYLTIAGSKTDITSHCVITAETVEIQSSYLDTLDVNVYYGEFDLGTRQFVLIVKDTRDLSINNKLFIKNSDYAYVDVGIYANTIINIEIADSAMHSIYNYLTEQIIIDGEFLDTLEEDVYILSVLYGQGVTTKTATAQVSVETRPATIQASSSYTYRGQQDLDISFNQQGDTVTSLILDGFGDVDTDDYQTSKNTLTIKKEFLLANGNGTFAFCINTEKGSALLFTVITAISDFALLYSEYTYDKASDADMTISAIIVNEEEFEEMQGALITADDYSINTSVGIIIDKEYVSQLPIGEYEFICISGDIQDYFTLIVINTNPKPYNLKLNYDIDPDEVYITFDCDCSAGHRYNLNDGPNVHFANRKIKIPSDDFYDKTQSNTLKITCLTSGLHTTITKNAPDGTAHSFLNTRYIFEGENRDKYIETQEEFNHFLRYMVMNGYDETMKSGLHPYSHVSDTVYYSQELLDELTPNTILSNGVESFKSPWGYEITTTNPANNIYNITISYTQKPMYDVFTNYTGQDTADTRELLVAGDRSPSFNSFYIETRTKTQTIRNTTELIELPLGVKPIFESAGTDAEVLYEAAKDICREFISDGMTDYQKVTVFYYWLAQNVAYDSESITVYNLSYNVNASSNIGQATNFIDAFILNNDYYIDDLTEIRDIPTLSLMKKAMDVYVKRMRVFAAEGALLDRKAVCNGIANAFLLLCKIEGIDAIRVSGTAFSNGGSENHAWNKVKIGGVWYVVDATWGRMGNFVTHKYLFASDYLIYDTHREEQQRNRGTRVIEYLASGHIDYYSTIIVDEYDLTIDSVAELNAVVAELYSQGVRTIELKYNLEEEFSATIASALSGVHGGGYQTVSAGDIYIVNLS